MQNKQLDKSPLLYLSFSAWSFVLLCRPQDYLSFLNYVRPNLVLAFITLVLLLLNKGNGAKVTANPQARLYIYFFLIMTASVPFSYYRSASLMDLIDYGKIFLFFLLFYRIVDTTEKLIKLLFLYCCGVAIYAMYILLKGNIVAGRISFGSMFDPNDIAFYVIGCLPFNLLFLLKNKGGYLKLLSLLNMVIGLIVILKTGSRGGLVALVVVIAYLLIFKHKALKIFVVKKAIIVILAIFSLQVIDMNIDRYKSIMDLQGDYNVTDEEGRIAIWGIGMRLMLTHPLTGVGLNRFPQGVGRDRESRGLSSAKWHTAHNSLIQVGAETGLFGFFIFAFLSVQAFRIFSNIINKSSDDELIMISEVARTGFIGMFVAAMFLSQAYSVYWAFYIALSAVMLRFYLENSASRSLDAKGTAH